MYDDIELCYKVLGLTFSDPPDQVDKVCRGLEEKYTRELHDPDHEIRAKAQNNLDQVRDLYNRITNSLIYRDYAREYERYNKLKAETQTEKQLKVEKPPEMVRCPYCNKQISEKLKVCLYCHGKILTPTELMLQKVFSKRNIAVAAVFLILVAGGVFLALNPQLLHR
jgi:uncharacterized protein with PIN domain